MPIEQFNSITIYDSLRRQAGDFAPEWLARLVANSVRGLQKSIKLDVETVENAFKNDANLRLSLEVLRTNGFCLMPSLEYEKLAEAKQQLDKVNFYDSDSYFETGANLNARFRRVAIPKGVHIASVAPEDYGYLTSFVKMANCPRTVSVVTNYLGALPTIAYVNGWISHPSAAARNAQLFHIDRHDFKFLKLFVYLTDVTEDSGPHSFVCGTHNVDTIREKLGGIAREDKRLEAIRTLTQLRLEDEFIFDFFGKAAVVDITGQATTRFLADTSGFHRGLVPRAGSREIFQAVYVLAQHPKDPVQKLKFDSFLSHYRRWYPESPFGDSEIMYMNRMLIGNGSV